MFSVSFLRVYVCVKAKLTLVSFFLLFFYAHFPNLIRMINFLVGDGVDGVWGRLINHHRIKER